MSAQTEPVDVLAVMDSCTDELEKQPGCYYTDAAKLQEARAAIAELIEAAAEVRAAHRELPSVDHPTEIRQEGEARIGRAHYALESAIARVGGGK